MIDENQDPIEEKQHPIEKLNQMLLSTLGEMEDALVELLATESFEPVAIAKITAIREIKKEGVGTAVKMLADALIAQMKEEAESETEASD